MNNQTSLRPTKQTNNALERIKKPKLECTAKHFKLDLKCVSRSSSNAKKDAQSRFKLVHARRTKAHGLWSVILQQYSLYCRIRSMSELKSSFVMQNREKAKQKNTKHPRSQPSTMGKLEPKTSQITNSQKQEMSGAEYV